MKLIIFLKVLIKFKKKENILNIIKKNKFKEYIYTRNFNDSIANLEDSNGFIFILIILFLIFIFYFNISF